MYVGMYVYLSHIIYLGEEGHWMVEYRGGKQMQRMYIFIYLSLYKEEREELKELMYENSEKKSLEVNKLTHTHIQKEYINKCLLPFVSIKDSKLKYKLTYS